MHTSAFLSSGAGGSSLGSGSGGPARPGTAGQTAGSIVLKREQACNWTSSPPSFFGVWSSFGDAFRTRLELFWDAYRGGTQGVHIFRHFSSTKSLLRWDLVEANASNLRHWPEANSLPRESMSLLDSPQIDGFPSRSCCKKDACRHAASGRSNPMFSTRIIITHNAKGQKTTIEPLDLAAQIQHSDCR